MRHSVFFSALFLACRAIAAESAPVVTNAAALACAMSEGRPVSFSLTATVTFLMPTNGFPIAVADSTGAVILANETACTLTGLRQGDTIRACGKTRTHWTDLQYAHCDSVTFLSHGEPLPPITTDAAAIIGGHYDHRFVRITGTVRDAFCDEIDPQWYFLVVRSGGRDIYVTFRSTGGESAALDAFVNAEVAISGICSPFNPGYRRQIGRLLRISGTKDIAVLKPPPDDLFNVPDITGLSRMRPDEIAALGRRKVCGQVDAVWHGDCVILRLRGDRFARVDLAQPRPPRFGDVVEAAGLPETDLYRINLTRAVWRPVSRAKGQVPTVNPVSFRTLLTDDNSRPRINPYFYGRTIRVRGIVRKLPSVENEGRRFYLESDAMMLSVDVSAEPSVISSVSVGCEVEVTGAFVTETGTWHHNSTFPHIKETFIVLRTSDDLRILKRPPWWTPRRLMTIIGTLFASLVAIFIWNVSLRRAAVRKGRELFREQLGHVQADLRTEERTRLAVELHDTLAQNLTGVSMEIEAASDLRGNAPQPMLDHLGIAAKALKSCRDELRNCLWDLRSQALDEKDMTRAILRTLQPCVADSRLAVRFDVPRSRLSDNTAHSLLRVIRELVANAIRHGKATSVRVAGAIDGARLLCSVTDNGCGFEPDSAPGVLKGHFGLQGIRERIDEFGGTFEIASSPGKGTRATLVIPIPHDGGGTTRTDSLI